MKRMFILAAALLAALAISAQEPNKFGLKKPDSPRSGKYELPDSLRNKFELPDSLAHLSPWKPDYRAEGKMKVKPSVTMTSVVVIQKENLPSRVTVIDNNTLRLGRHFTISNGQAWNNGSFPDAFLDARTISMPPAAVGCCCPFRRNADPVRTSFRRAQFPDGSVNWKSPGTAIRGVLQAPIRTGA